MTGWRLVRQGLRHFARTHLAVTLGVAVATAALAGALLVGHSVRESLRELALGRLGPLTHVVAAPGFVREELAEALAGAPVVLLEASVAHADSGRRAGPVQVFGVDGRAWRLLGQAEPELAGRSALLGEALAAELGSRDGEALLLRFEAPGDLPPGLLYGRRDLGRTLRLTQAGTRSAAQAGELSLRPRQGSAFTLFVPLATLQRALARPGAANAVLLAAGPPGLGAASLHDLGVRLRDLGERGLAVEGRSALVSDALAAATAEAAASLGARTAPALVGLAIELRAGERRVPDSLLAGLPADRLAGLGAPALADDELVANDWLARELSAGPGDPVELEYQVWEEEGRIETRQASFRLAGVVPLAGAAADPDLAPAYPGITDAAHVADWDPPFPIDLSRVRPQDERYWEQHRATPKAFVTLAAAQRLFGHRLGRLTSVRVSGASGADFGTALRARLDPLQHGLSVVPVREQALLAARGSGDFGAYFAGFSSLLVGSALLLAGLFFRLGVEQRLRELGLLRALGFAQTRVRRLLLAEGAVVAGAGAAFGVLLGLAHAAAVLLGLRTVWLPAVGTRALGLHAAVAPLAIGALLALLCGLLTLVLSLRGLRHATPRGLLGGTLRDALPAGRPPTILVTLLPAVLAVAALAAAAAGSLPQAPAFFGGGALLLASGLLATRRLLDRPLPLPGLLGLGLRGAAERPGRSLLVVALIAGATFLLVAAGSFRRSAEAGPGSGGFALLAESLLPLHHDLRGAAGRAELGLPADLDATIVPLRLQPGDDASCLNLYRPGQPRVLGAPPELVAAARFPGASGNPWPLLGVPQADGAVPALADANSLQYVLHAAVGDVVEAGAQRFRIVGALRDSLFQSELVVAEADFLRAFPGQAGYRFFLVDVPAGREAAVSEALEAALGDFGFDAQLAAARLATFHRVENTYLATFQALGALGLLLGSVGLFAVLLRNALERRRELALLCALGFARGRLGRLVLIEHGLLLGLGLALGTGAALFAVAPALLSRGTLPAGTEVLGLLALVPAVGLAATRLAVRQVLRWPLVASLRAE